jgi:predicted  nucleic acid-binding Zn-ribbon protein
MESVQLEPTLNPVGGFVHPDVAALLAVQDEDVAITQLEHRLSELKPRLDALAKARDDALASLKKAESAAESEERRRQEIAARVAQHRTQQAKNEATLSSVTSMREATAATAQLEQTKRMIDEGERELATVGQRLVDANHRVEECRRVAVELELAQATATASLNADQQEIEVQLGTIRAARQERARDVPGSLLSRYERIRSRKRVHAVFPLRGASCGNCDTMIPLQRRSGMLGTGATEICEGCGVMLYAAD